MRRVLGIWLVLLGGCSCGGDVVVRAPDDAGADGSWCELDWYPDEDGDGFGAGDAPSVRSCLPVAGHASRGQDCDDENSTVRPGSPEVCDDVDNDCRNGVDDGLQCGPCLCALPNTASVSCLADATACEIAICDQGFLDCDSHDATGCESDRTAVTSCGHCGNVCDPNAACVAVGGVFTCACEPGLSGDGATCAPCPTGYYGTDGVCGPVLTGLELSTGTLSPVLSDDVNAYAVQASLSTQTITLTPTADADATITINGDVVASGSDWQSPTLDLGPNTITVRVSQGDQPIREYEITVDRDATQVAYVKPAYNNGGAFGSDVAISGDTMVVGAPHEHSGAIGVNDDPSASGNGNGAAYVFVRSGDTWSQQAFLKASNPGPVDMFGGSVAIDGDTIVVGACYEQSSARGVDGDQMDDSANSSGAAYVFVREGSSWSQQAYLKASNSEWSDYFGNGVAVYGDTVAIGATGESSNATGIDGDQSNNASFASGAVYVFARRAGTWSQQAYVKASHAPSDNPYVSRPYFGLALSLWGETLVVGAPNERSAARGINGDDSDESAPGSGAAYVFTRSGGTWSQQAYLKASNAEANDGFGGSLAISGDTIVVTARGESSRASGINGDPDNNGAPSSGAAYVFVRNGDTWSQQAYLKGRNLEGDGFGASAAIFADTIVVGASQNGTVSDNTSYSFGCAYAFGRSMGTWSQRAYLSAENAELNDYFGTAVAVYDDTIVIGARGEDSNAEGVGGDQTNNRLVDSGAVYVFE